VRVGQEIQALPRCAGRPGLGLRSLLRLAAGFARGRAAFLYGVSLWPGTPAASTARRAPRGSLPDRVPGALDEAQSGCRPGFVVQLQPQRQRPSALGGHERDRRFDRGEAGLAEPEADHGHRRRPPRRSPAGRHFPQTSDPARAGHPLRDNAGRIGGQGQRPQMPGRPITVEHFHAMPHKPVHRRLGLVRHPGNNRMPMGTRPSHRRSRTRRPQHVDRTPHDKAAALRGHGRRPLERQLPRNDNVPRLSLILIGRLTRRNPPQPNQPRSLDAPGPTPPLSPPRPADPGPSWLASGPLGPGPVASRPHSRLSLGHAAVGFAGLGPQPPSFAAPGPRPPGSVPRGLRPLGFAALGLRLLGFVALGPWLLALTAFGLPALCFGPLCLMGLGSDGLTSARAAPPCPASSCSAPPCSAPPCSAPLALILASPLSAPAVVCS
jgi:hypothetical protein